MSNLPPGRRFVATGVAATLLALLSACAKTTLPAVGSLSPTDQISLREPLARAASITVPDFETLTQAATAPRLNSLGGKNHPFTLVLLALRPEAVDADLDKLNAELPIGKVPPAEIFHQMIKSQPAGYASMIQSEDIQLVDGQVSMDKSIPVAKGFVQYRIAENSSASVEYEARFEYGVWNVIRFTMPAWQVQTVKQPDGTWLASGSAVRTEHAALPRVTGAVAPRDESAGRFVVEIRTGKSDSNTHIFVHGQPPELTVSDFAKESPRLIHEFEAAGNSRATAVFVIRADKDIPLTEIDRLTVSAVKQGFRKFALAAMASGIEGDTLGDLPFAGPETEYSGPDAASPMELVIRADGDGQLVLNTGEPAIHEDDSLDALESRLTAVQKLLQMQSATRIVVRGGPTANAAHLARVLSSTPAIPGGVTGQGLLVVGQPISTAEMPAAGNPASANAVDSQAPNIPPALPVLNPEPFAEPADEIGTPNRSGQQKRNGNR